MKDWRDGDVFANSTCYDEELMAKIAEKAIGMKKGRSLSASARSSRRLRDLEDEMMKMSGERPRSTSCRR